MSWLKADNRDAQGPWSPSLVIDEDVGRSVTPDDLRDGKNTTATAARAQDTGIRLTAERDMTDRLMTYSDAVFAVIVTIMVLQLVPPKSRDFSALYVLWPKLISYVVSYVFIAIIWINHHHLTRFIRTSSQRLIWTNFIHLFLVSLVPFTTEWMAETKLAPIPVVVYAGLFVCADGAYNVFERHILRHTNEIAERGRRWARRRSILALMLFSTATLVAAFQPWIGFGLICAALVLHLKPDIGPKRRADQSCTDTTTGVLDTPLPTGREL